MPRCAAISSAVIVVRRKVRISLSRSVRTPARWAESRLRFSRIVRRRSWCLDPCIACAFKRSTITGSPLRKGARFRTV